MPTSALPRWRSVWGLLSASLLLFFSPSQRCNSCLPLPLFCSHSVSSFAMLLRLLFNSSVFSSAPLCFMAFVPDSQNTSLPEFLTCASALPLSVLWYFGIRFQDVLPLGSFLLMRWYGLRSGQPQCLMTKSVDCPASFPDHPRDHQTPACGCRSWHVWVA